MTKKELDHRQYLKIKDTAAYKARRARTSTKWQQGLWAQVKIKVLAHYGPDILQSDSVGISRGISNALSQPQL